MTIFWGMCLILFDIYLSFGSAQFDILPDLIGWLLVADGVSRILSFDWSEAVASKAKTLTWQIRIMIGVSAVVLLWNLFGTSGVFYVIFSLLSEVLGLYTTYCFCDMFCMLEAECQKDWNSRKLLREFWKFLACYVVGTVLLYLLPLFDSYFILGIAVLLLLAGTFLFLFELYHACRWWTDDPYPNSEEDENEETT